MDRRGGQGSGSSSSQGRSAWNTPLQSKSPHGGASGSVAEGGVSSKVLVKKNPVLSFNSKPAVQNVVYSSSDEDSESGGEGGVQGRNVDALESKIMADYPSAEDMDDTGEVVLLF